MRQTIFSENVLRINVNFFPRSLFLRDVNKVGFGTDFRRKIFLSLKILRRNVKSCQEWCNRVNTFYISLVLLSFFSSSPLFELLALELRTWGATFYYGKMDGAELADERGIKWEVVAGLRPPTIYCICHCLHACFD